MEETYKVCGIEPMRSCTLWHCHHLQDDANWKEADASVGPWSRQGSIVINKYNACGQRERINLVFIWYMYYPCLWSDAGVRATTLPLDTWILFRGFRNNGELLILLGWCVFLTCCSTYCPVLDILWLIWSIIVMSQCDVDSNIGSDLKRHT